VTTARTRPKTPAPPKPPKPPKPPTPPKPPRPPATEAAEALGWEVRAIRIDGEDQAMTLDLRPNRVNVAVEDGEVTEVLQIG
jgi:hypothetical protein